MKKLITAVLIVVCAFAAALPVSAVYLADYPVTAFADDIALDGSVTAEEWGDPICTFTPQDCLDNRVIGWGYRNYSTIPTDQKVNIYLTNDGDCVYIACQLVGAKKDMTCDSIGGISAHPHFCFTIGAYYEGTTVQHTIFNSQEYERYTSYGIGFVNGEAAIVAKAQGITTTNHLPVDYAASYDEDTRTYTYEVSVPLFNTNIDINANPVVVMSFDIGDAGSGSTSGNRYLIARGADKALDASMGPYIYAHGKTNPPTFELHKTSVLSGKRFIPTEEDAAAAELLRYDSAAVYDVIEGGRNLRPLGPAVIITGAAAGVCVIFAVIIAAASKKRRYR